MAGGSNERASRRAKGLGHEVWHAVYEAREAPSDQRRGIRPTTGLVEGHERNVCLSENAPPMRVRKPEQIGQRSGDVTIGVEGRSVDPHQQVDGERESLADLRWSLHSGERPTEVVEVLVGVRDGNLLDAMLESRNVGGYGAPTFAIEWAVLVPPHEHEEAKQVSPLGRGEP